MFGRLRLLSSKTRENDRRTTDSLHTSVPPSPLLPPLSPVQKGIASKTLQVDKSTFMIEVDNLSIQAGEFRVDDVSFAVPTSQYAVLMGRTGSGKTTILEAICGLKTIRGGEIRLGGRNVTSLRPAERGIGFVPQDAALFDSMTVADHLDFALRIRRWPQRERTERVARVAAMVGVEHLLTRKPLGLSGGERQRVALGRAISFQPATLCLDEPLSALDDDSRREMIGLVKHIQQETGVTALHVTHNLHEAESLADVRFQLEDGRVTRNGV